MFNRGIHFSVKLGYRAMKRNLKNRTTKLMLRLIINCYNYIITQATEHFS